MTESREGLFQIGIGMACPTCEQFDNAADLTAGENRKEKHALQPGESGTLAADEGGILGKIGAPERLAFRPDTSYQALPIRERSRARYGFQFRAGEFRGVPQSGAAQQSLLTVRSPEAAPFPS